MRIHELFENQKFSDLPKPAYINNDLAVDAETRSKPFATADDYAKECVTWMNKHCAPWLELAGDQIVYRGIRYTDRPSGVFGVVPIRHDRRPMDSPLVYHEMLNAAIAQAGLKADRSNSAFVTNINKLSGDYGDSMVVMPVDDFHYTWNTISRDAYSDKYEIARHAGVEFSELDIWDSNKNEYPEQVVAAARKKFVDFISKYYQGDEGTYSGLQEAIASGNEVMIHANHLLFIEPDFYNKRLAPLL